MSDAARPFVAHRYAIYSDGSREKLSDLAFPMLHLTSREGFLDLLNEWNLQALMEWNERTYRILYVAA